MKKHIAALEGELEGVRMEQAASGQKGAAAPQSSKAVATGEPEDETARLIGEVQRLQAAEAQASSELEWCAHLLTAVMIKILHAQDTHHTSFHGCWRQSTVCRPSCDCRYLPFHCFYAIPKK